MRLCAKVERIRARSSVGEVQQQNRSKTFGGLGSNFLRGPHTLADLILIFAADVFLEDSI